MSRRGVTRRTSARSDQNLSDDAMDVDPPGTTFPLKEQPPRDDEEREAETPPRPRRRKSSAKSPRGRKALTPGQRYAMEQAARLGGTLKFGRKNEYYYSGPSSRPGPLFTLAQGVATLILLAIGAALVWFAHQMTQDFAVWLSIDQTFLAPALHSVRTLVFGGVVYGCIRLYQDNVSRDKYLVAWRALQEGNLPMTDTARPVVRVIFDLAWWAWVSSFAAICALIGWSLLTDAPWSELLYTAGECMAGSLIIFIIILSGLRSALAETSFRPTEWVREGDRLAAEGSAPDAAR